MMKVQKLVPGGSYTYSTSSLKLCQGGPHLQSNLTTKVKYSTTSNQILEMPTGTALPFALRGGIEESYVRYLVCVLLTWRICRPCIAPVQCHDCFGKERAPNLHERESWRHTQLAFDQGANNPGVNIVITTYKVAVFTTNSLLIQQERIKVN